MPITHVTVSEAHKLQQDGATYVDVRSTGEFAQGHPAGAVNVPVIEPDEDTGQMQPNADFLRVMKAAFAPDAKLLVGCQMGGRSMRAAQMLASSGFADVANVRGGFGGSSPMGGGAYEEGWAAAGLPVEAEDEPGSSYRTVLAKADGA